MAEPTAFHVSGTCFCAAVSVILAAPPRSMLLCACLDCQRATGAGHAALALMALSDVAVTGQTGSWAVTAASGAQTTRCFCARCGTPVFGKSSRASAYMLVAAGFFVGHSNWFRPTALIFARSMLDWDKIDDKIPRYETYKP